MTDALQREGGPGPIYDPAELDAKPPLLLETASGQRIAPTFLFPDGVPVPRLPHVLHQLPADVVSRQTAAARLNSPEFELDERRPIECLQAVATDVDLLVERVVTVAPRWAATLGLST